MGPLTFTTADGLRLEGEIRAPEGPPRGTAILCHPLPTHGGSKDHPLLWAIRNELAGRRGLTVLAFNFRGVMGSEGKFGDGVAELADAEAAITRAREEAEGPTLLAGWSFGASVALRQALRDERVAALALIGMAVADTAVRLPDLPGRDELRGLTIPVLLLSGAADQFSPAPDLRSLAAKMPSSEVEIVPDTDHFFWRREREVAEMVGTFADRALAQ